MKVSNSCAKRKRALIAISAFLIIYLTDTLLFATSTLAPLTLARRIVPVVVAVVSIFILRKVELKILLAVTSIVITMLLYASNNSVFFYMSAISLLVCGYAYAKAVSLEEFEEFYIKWMRIIAIVSLAGFVFGNIIKTMGFIPTVTNSVGNRFKTLLLTNIPMSGSLSRRNYGPFWEPGVYQYYLNVALIFVLHRQGKRMWLDAALIVVTLLTTLSGAAILPLPFIVLAYIANNRKQKSLKPYVFALIILVLSVMLMQTKLFDEIIHKITGKDLSLSSGFRIGSALANLQMTLRYPLFGASPAMQNQTRMEMIHTMNGYKTSGNTNTMLGFTSYFGIFVGLFYWKNLYGFTRKISESVFSALCLFAALFLMTSNENLILSALIYVLMFLKPNNHMRLNKDSLCLEIEK